MEINVDFSPLNDILFKYEISEKQVKLPKINQIVTSVFEELGLYNGIKITDEDVTIEVNDFITYHGKLVVLYIEGHENHYAHELIKNPSVAKKFHLFNCASLKDMRKKGKFNKYFITNNDSGLFRVKAMDGYVNVPLKVCLNCLHKLPNKFREIWFPKNIKLSNRNAFELKEYFFLLKDNVK